MLKYLVDEYGENANHDKKYLLFMLIVIISLSVQLILTKRLLSRSKINLIIFAFWVYFFGVIGTFFIYCIECWQRDSWTILEWPAFLALVEEVIAVLAFSCCNEVVNYTLLLYLAKKTFITKASGY